MESFFYNALNIALKSDYSKITKLKNHHPTWQSAWESLDPQTKKEIQPEKEWQKLETSSIELILNSDSKFPALLKEIPHPPFGLYLKGNLEILQKDSIAIVGTRKATPSGKELARNFAEKLSQFDFNIVSGLALGIDTESHLGTLKNQKSTTAVLGNGLGKIYPRLNENLARQILNQNGLLISEYPLNSPSLPYRFLERNRIVSGLSRGILIIEAPERSGSLATARFALDQNREIFVVPGPITHPNFKGSHELIRQGAILVTKPEHILEVLRPEALVEEKFTPNLFVSTEEENKILTLFKNSGQTLNVDKIIELTKLDVQVVNQTLSFLIIKNIIHETENGYTL